MKRTRPVLAPSTRPAVDMGAGLRAFLKEQRAKLAKAEAANDCRAADLALEAIHHAKARIDNVVAGFRKLQGHHPKKGPLTLEGDEAEALLGWIQQQAIQKAEVEKTLLECSKGIQSAFKWAYGRLQGIMDV